MATVKTMTAEVAKAIQRVDDAKSDLHALIARTYPPGTEVRYIRNLSVCYGRVFEVSYTRLLVQNFATTKKYWINVYDLVR